MSKDKKNNTNRMVALVMGIIGLTLTITPVPQALVHFKPNWILFLLIFLSINSIQLLEITFEVIGVSINA